MINCLCFPPSDLLSCSLPTNPFLLGPLLVLQASEKQSNSQCWKTPCHRQFPHSIANPESPLLSPSPKQHKSGTETSSRYGTLESGSSLRTRHSYLRCLVKGYNFPGYSYAKAVGTNLRTLRLAYKSYFGSVCKPPFFPFWGFCIISERFLDFPDLCIINRNV